MNGEYYFARKIHYFYFFALIPAVVSDLLCHFYLHLYYLQSFLHTFMTYNYCVKLPLKLPPLQAWQSHLQVQLRLNNGGDVAFHSLQVYVTTFGEHVGFRIFMDSILLSLTRKVKHSGTVNNFSFADAILFQECSVMCVYCCFGSLRRCGSPMWSFLLIWVTGLWRRGSSQTKSIPSFPGAALIIRRTSSCRPTT